LIIVSVLALRGDPCRRGVTVCVLQSPQAASALIKSSCVSSAWHHQALNEAASVSPCHRPLTAMRSLPINHRKKNGRPSRA
jgi:hypothetical protein